MIALRKLAAMGVVVLASATLSRADDVANPAFEGWAKFNVGSSETFEGVVDVGGKHMDITATLTLIEKAADHVVIGTTSTTVIDGQSHTMPMPKVTIPANGDSSKEMKQIGTEDVVAAGKTYSCKIFVPAHPKADAKATSKIWANSDIPGGAVKMEINASGRTITQLLKSFEVK